MKYYDVAAAAAAAVDGRKINVTDAHKVFGKK